MTDARDPHQGEPNPGEDIAEDRAEPQIEVTFLDRVIAFLLLVWPFSYLISLVQDLMADHLPTSVRNITVLIGIVLFLIVVDKVSKRIYRLRQRQRT